MAWNTAQQPISNTTLGKDANLVSLWSMNGNANDSIDSNSGTATNVTFNSSNTPFSGKQGGGYNGTSKIVINDASNLKITSNFTIAVVFKSPMPSGVNPSPFCSNSRNTNLAGIWLDLQDSVGKARLFSGRNTGTVAGTDYQKIQCNTNSCDSNPHWLVGVWDGTNLRIYLDGSSDATAVSWSNAPGYAATNYIRIGCYNITGTDVDFFPNNSYIAEVAVFNRALSSTEISNHASGVDVIGGGAFFAFF